MLSLIRGLSGIVSSFENPGNTVAATDPAKLFFKKDLLEFDIFPIDEQVMRFKCGDKAMRRIPFES